MSIHDTAALQTAATDANCTEHDERDVRALTECISVLEDVGPAAGAPGLFLVVSQSGREYLVDDRTGTCECPDSEYRGSRCKHLRRVAFATGQRAIPADVDGVDDLLGEHTNGSVRRAVTDGGQVVDRENAIEYTRHVEPPEQGGERYVRCEACGAELLEKLGGEDRLVHSDDCPAGEGR